MNKEKIIEEYKKERKKILNKDLNKALNGFFLGVGVGFLIILVFFNFILFGIIFNILLEAPTHMIPFFALSLFLIVINVFYLIILLISLIKKEDLK